MSAKHVFSNLYKRLCKYLEMKNSVSKCPDGKKKKKKMMIFLFLIDFIKLVS